MKEIEINERVQAKVPNEKNENAVDEESLLLFYFFTHIVYI